MGGMACLQCGGLWGIKIFNHWYELQIRFSAREAKFCSKTLFLPITELQMFNSFMLPTRDSDETTLRSLILLFAFSVSPQCHHWMSLNVTVISSCLMHSEQRIMPQNNAFFRHRNFWQFDMLASPWQYSENLVIVTSLLLNASRCVKSVSWVWMC